MSEPIPESIPTSQDPRSKRPTKKRALTPVSAQAANLDALFAKPDQEIRFPSTALAKPLQSGGPPEIVANVQGSSAGAGSGEFHVYKASRRREYERLRAMDEEVKGEKEAEEFETAKRQKEERDNEKTRKNREKREKMKAKKGKGKGKGKSGDGDGGEIRQQQVDVSARAVADTTVDPVESDPEIHTADAAPEAGIVIHDDD